MTDHGCFFNIQQVQQGIHIRSEIGHGKICTHSLRLAEATQIWQDQVEIIFQKGYQCLPDSMIERITMQQHQRNAFAVPLVSEFNSINFGC